MEVADRMFGVTPILALGVMDRARVLTKAQVEAADTIVRRITEQFPQVYISALINRLEKRIPIKPYLFWVFNRCGVFPEFEKAENAYHVLLHLDAGGNRASMMVGYGLERILSEEIITEIIQSSESLFRAGKGGAALKRLLLSLEAELQTQWDQYPEKFGISSEEMLKEESHEEKAEKEEVRQAKAVGSGKFVSDY